MIPEILASLALEPVVKRLFDNDPVKVVMLGGAVRALDGRPSAKAEPEEKAGNAAACLAAR